MVSLLGGILVDIFHLLKIESRKFLFNLRMNFIFHLLKFRSVFFKRFSCVDPNIVVLPIHTIALVVDHVIFVVSLQHVPWFSQCVPVELEFSFAWFNLVIVQSSFRLIEFITGISFLNSSEQRLIRMQIHIESRIVQSHQFGFIVHRHILLILHQKPIAHHLCCVQILLQGHMRISSSHTVFNSILSLKYQ